MSGHHSGSHPSRASQGARGLQQLPPMRLLGHEQIMAAEVAAANLVGDEPLLMLHRCWPACGCFTDALWVLQQRCGCFIG